MGLSVTVSASIVFMALILASTTLSAGLFISMSLINKSVEEQAYLSQRDVLTIVKVDNASMQNPVWLEFYVSNVGFSKLWNFQSCDVIVSYTGREGKNTFKVVEKLVYSAPPPGRGGWSIVQFYNDLNDPKILNPRETMLVRGQLSYEVARGSVVTVVFSTDSGFSYEYSFVWMG